jgi:tRNA threonylcarbamoyladenosine biosynthesis protein TsaE
MPMNAGHQRRSALVEFITRTPAETEALGERLGRLLSGGEVLALIGPLGAGKTVFVRGLARALGCAPGEVASPTYVLERVYPGRLALRHLDAYRLSGAAEFEASDLGAALGASGSVAAVEWADRVAGAMPAGGLEVNIAVLGADERRLVFRAGSEPGRRLLGLLPAGA